MRSLPGWFALWLVLWAVAVPAFSQGDAADPADRPLPDSYVQFVQIAEDLVAPLVPLLKEGSAVIDIEGPPSDHDAMADRLESVARPGLLLALWLQTEPLDAADRKHDFTRAQVAEWMRQSFVTGTDRDHANYWGDLYNYHQNGVEMAIMTMSLAVSRDWVWDKLSEAERDQVAAWLGQMRGTPRYWNNHLFFAVLTIEFLNKEGYGKPGDRAAIGYMMDLLESMHIGNGWFKDGVNETFDYYNAYAFHTYGQWWVDQYGHADPARAERWRNWAHPFVQDLAHFYAASGEHVPYGRSITYRFNGLGAFGLAAKLDLGALPRGEMRRICRKNLEFFMASAMTQSQGLLSLGWTDEFPDLAEPYSAPGSPYWASKGLMMLTLPPDHAFWTDEEQPYPAERGDFARVIPAPRFVMRGIDGQIELLNAGSQIARGNGRRYGPWKWSKLAYRTELGFLIGEDITAYPTDAVLTVERQTTGDRFGRQPTTPVAVSDRHQAYLYTLGTRESKFNVPVRTDVFWNGGWVLAIHRASSVEPVRFLHGSFALGLDTNDRATTDAEDHYARASNGTQHSAIQSLGGFTASRFDRRPEDGPRQHLTHPEHVTPVLTTDWGMGERVLPVLIWAGDDPEDGAPWEPTLTDEGRWTLTHPTLGRWDITHDMLPGIERE